MPAALATCFVCGNLDGAWSSHPYRNAIDVVVAIERPAVLFIKRYSNGRGATRQGRHWIATAARRAQAPCIRACGWGKLRSAAEGCFMKKMILCLVISLLLGAGGLGAQT